MSEEDMEDVVGKTYSSVWLYANKKTKEVASLREKVRNQISWQLGFKIKEHLRDEISE